MLLFMYDFTRLFAMFSSQPQRRSGRPAIQTTTTAMADDEDDEDVTA